MTQITTSSSSSENALVPVFRLTMERCAATFSFDHCQRFESRWRFEMRSATSMRSRLVQDQCHVQRSARNEEAEPDCERWQVVWRWF